MPLTSTDGLLLKQLTSAMLESKDAEPEIRDLLTREKEKALKKIGWDPENRIYSYNKGPYTYHKIGTPIQKSSKDRNHLISVAYDFYFGKESDKSDWTVKQCFYEQIKKLKNLASKGARSEETIIIYIQKFKKFCEEYPKNYNGSPSFQETFADFPIARVTKHKLLEYIEASVTDFSLSKDGLRDFKTVVGLPFTYAATEGIIDFNILKTIDTRTIYTFDENVKHLKAYTREEIQKLLDVMTDECVLSSYRSSSIVREAAAALCLETQLSVRAGETRSMKVSDVCFDFGDERIDIHSFIRRTRDSEGKRCYEYRNLTKAKSREGDRSPGLSDFAISIIKQQIERHPDSEYLFCNKNGKPLAENALSQWLKRFCDIAGVEYKRPHCLRCTAITSMNSHGIDKTRIQHTSGQLDPNTTDRYIDASRSEDISHEEANAIYVKPSNFKA